MSADIWHLHRLDWHKNTRITCWNQPLGETCSHMLQLIRESNTQPGNHLHSWVNWSNVEWNKLAQGFNTAANDANPGYFSRRSEAIQDKRCCQNQPSDDGSKLDLANTNRIEESGLSLEHGVYCLPLHENGDVHATWILCPQQGFSTELHV